MGNDKRMNTFGDGVPIQNRFFATVRAPERSGMQACAAVSGPSSMDAATVQAVVARIFESEEADSAESLENTLVQDKPDSPVSYFLGIHAEQLSKFSVVPQGESHLQVNLQRFYLENAKPRIEQQAAHGLFAKLWGGESNSCYGGVVKAGEIIRGDGASFKLHEGSSRRVDSRKHHEGL